MPKGQESRGKNNKPKLTAKEKAEKKNCNRAIIKTIFLFSKPKIPNIEIKRTKNNVLILSLLLYLSVHLLKTLKQVVKLTHLF